jgi:hypothetical protein
MSKTMLAAAMLAAMTASLALGTGGAEARKYPTKCPPGTPPSVCEAIKGKKTKPYFAQQTSAWQGMTSTAGGATQRADKPTPPPACRTAICYGVGGIKVKSPRPKD